MENKEVIEAFRVYEKRVKMFEKSMNKLIQQASEEELSEEELMELESLQKEIEQAKKQIEENKEEEVALLELEVVQKEINDKKKEAIDLEKQLKRQEHLISDLKQGQKPERTKVKSSSNFLGKFLKSLFSNKGKKASWDRKRMQNGTRKQI